MKVNRIVKSALVVVASAVVLAGCSLITDIRDEYSSSIPDTITVALGGENTLNVTKVTVDDAEDSSLVGSITPSAWNALDEFTSVSLYKGETVEFTFTQPSQGDSAWKTWALAFYSSANKGNFLRGDNWLNISTDVGFTSGLWVDGGSTANGTWSNNYTYETCASKLPTNATVVISVAFDGSNVTVTETVDGILAYTTTSSAW